MTTLSLEPPVVLRIPQLLKKVATGAIAMPRFQRSFEWRETQRLDLLDSVWRGIPIGSIMVWRTRRQISTEERVGPFAVPQPDDDDRGRTRDYLLDGLQRTTTLFASLGGHMLATASGSDLNEDESDEDPTRWPSYFDLENQCFELLPRRGRVPETWLPMSILLDRFELIEYQRTLADLEHGKQLVNRSGYLSDLFKDYHIPVIYIATDDLQLATKSFKRINSGGTRLGDFDMVRALTWRSSFDLREQVADLSERLRDIGWHHLTRETILNVMKAIAGMDLYRTSIEDISQYVSSSPALFQDTEEAIRAMAAFLAERCDIHGLKTLPYMYQCVLIAMVHADGPALSEVQLKALERWFWLTSYTQYFSGISEARLARTMKHLQTLRDTDFDPRPPRLPNKVVELDRFQFNWVRSKLLALLMARRLPRSLRNGKERKNGPRTLARYGNDCLLRLFAADTVTRRLRASPANMFIVPPRDVSGFQDLMREALAQPTDGFLASHFIDEEALHAWGDSDDAKFLTIRARLIADAEEAFVRSLGLEYERL